MNGLRAEDFVGPETGLTMDDIQTYKFPPMEELTKVGGNKGVTGIFLGYFFNWKVRENVAAIEQYGWSHHDGRPETTYCDFNNLDCLSMNLYDYVKYCKYGYGRATDDACRDVRDEIIDRKQAVRLVERYDGVYPKATVKAWAEKFGLTPEDFDEICDRFTNPEIFEYEDGKFVRDIDNSLIMITSMDREGTMEGYDFDLVRSVQDAVSIPVIANGGAGLLLDVSDLIEKTGVQAVACSSLFLFTDNKPIKVKSYLQTSGIQIRPI